ncbi:MAG: MBL fold metallo-hydrolase [Balneolaceae bacterium]
MKLETFTVGPFTENTYLLSEENHALLIDPGFSDQKEFINFREYFSESGTRLLAVLLTHAHVDHILGLQSVIKDFEVPVYLNHSDLFLWENFESQSRMFGIRSYGFDFIPKPLPEQQGYTIGPFTFDILYTPGHAPDHVSLYFRDEDILIAGDTLFRESIGRTDLYKGDFNLLKQSIQDKLYTLPNDTKVYPGHGPETTIGYEKQNNNFVREHRV